MADLSKLITTLESPLNDPQNIPVLYQVKPGDTLSKIIHDYYGIGYKATGYDYAEASIVYFNNLKSPDRIRVDQLLRLMPLPSPGEMQACEMPEAFTPYELPPTLTRHWLEPANPNYTRNIESHIPLTQAEKDAFWTLAWWDYAYPFLSHSAGGGLIAFGGLVGQSNTQLLKEVGVLYDQFKNGFITKGQYDYGRQQLLTKYKSLIGPLEKRLFSGKTVQEAIRINRAKALPATVNIEAHAARLARLSKLASRGGVVLSVAGLGAGCYQIANTADQNEKNEIFVETLASTISGAAGGLLVTALLFTNPVGWGIALVAGTTVAAGSWSIGKGAKAFYNAKGQQIDLVKLSGTDKLCS